MVNISIGWLFIIFGVGVIIGMVSCIYPAVRDVLEYSRRMRKTLKDLEGDYNEN